MDQSLSCHQPNKGDRGPGANVSGRVSFSPNPHRWLRMTWVVRQSWNFYPKASVTALTSSRTTDTGRNAEKDQPRVLPVSTHRAQACSAPVTPGLIPTRFVRSPTRIRLVFLRQTLHGKTSAFAFPGCEEATSLTRDSGKGGPTRR